MSHHTSNKKKIRNHYSHAYINWVCTTYGNLNRCRTIPLKCHEKGNLHIPHLLHIFFTSESTQCIKLIKGFPWASSAPSSMSTLHHGSSKFHHVEDSIIIIVICILSTTLSKTYSFSSSSIWQADVLTLKVRCTIHVNRVRSSQVQGTTHMSALTRSRARTYGQTLRRAST